MKPYSQPTHAITISVTIPTIVASSTLHIAMCHHSPATRRHCPLPLFSLAGLGFLVGA